MRPRQESSTSRQRPVESSMPVSMGPSEIMEVGAVASIAREFTTLALEEYNVATKSWYAINKTSTFMIDKVRFAAGGFRFAFKANQLSGKLEGSSFVVKRYRDTAIQAVTEKGTVTIDDAVRKQVQMHMFARNYVKLLKAEAPKEYGEHFKMGKAYHATTTKGEPLFIEPFIEGRFDKYVNNNGTVSSVRNGDEQQQELQSKAEALCHFSYSRSSKFAMVLDIQGCGFSLTDPEVATIERKDNSENNLFCGGNLNLKAITAFMYQHECNDYCRMLKLSDSY